MPTAINLFLYFLSVFVGGLWAPALLNRLNPQKLDQWQMLALTSMAGILTLYVSFVGLQNFNWSYSIQWGLGVLALPFLSVQWKKNSWVEYALLTGFCTIAFAIVFTPLEAWDARSIWFFHSKILHQSSSYWSPDWKVPEFAFSHPHYPKLFPTLVAYTLSPWPDWNSYLPKMALLPLLVASVSGLLSFSLPQRSSFYLGLAFLGLPGAFLWNGYLDAYLAIFFSLATIALHITFLQNSSYAAVLFLLTSGILISLKQEGIVLFICLTLTSLLFYKKLFTHKKIFLFVIPLVLFFIQLYIKNRMNIPDYFMEDTQRLFNFKKNILEHHGLSQMSLSFLRNLIDVLLFFVISFIFSKLLKAPQFFSFSKFFWTNGTVYLGILSIVYITTSFDLTWYLDTSASRTLLAVKLMWVVSCLSLDQKNIFNASYEQ